MSSKVILALGASAALIGLLGARGVVAQTAQTAAAPDTGLEEIVVTARRREERVQSVPLSITAFSQADIEKEHIEKVSDLQRAVPSLSISISQSDANAPYSSQTRLRGLAGSVIYFADVPLGSADYAPTTGLTHGTATGFYYDLDNLEVTKGPQGTLFGKNSIGGLVSISPKKPTDEFEGYLQLTYGNYNDKEFEGAVNIPIIADKLLVRIAGEGQLRDGYTKDYFTGKEYDNRDDMSWRVGVTFRPTDDIDNYFIYDGYYQDTNGSSTIARYVKPGTVFSANPLGIGLPLTLGKGPSITAVGTALYVDNLTHANPLTDPVVLGAFAAGATSFYPNIAQDIVKQQELGARVEYGHAIQGIGKDYFYGFTNTTNWDINDDLLVKNIAAARIFKQMATTDDFGAGQLPVLNIGIPGNESQWGDNSIQYTEELQLQGKALNEKLSWVVGGFVEYDGPLGDTLLPTTTLGNTVYYHFNNSDRSQAAFIHGTYDLSDYVDGLKFTAGYRYTWDWVSEEESGTNAVDAVTRVNGVAQNCAPVVNVDNNCHVSADGNFSSYGWNLGLDEQLTPSTLIYIRSGNAYRPGGFNLNVNPSEERFQPEHVTDVELGVKTDWDLFGIHGRTNADIYHTDYKNIQIQELVQVVGRGGNTAVNSAYENAASAYLEGAELEGAIEPYKGVTITPHASYIYTHYNQYPTQFSNGVASPPFLYLPKLQYGVTGTYRLPLDESLGDVSLSATYTWTGHAYDNVEGGEIYPITSSYDEVDVRADWKNFLNYPVDLGFFMTNALNTTHIVGVFPIYAQIGFTSVVYNEPRMFGFSVKYRFGPGTEADEAAAPYTPPPAVAAAPAPSASIAHSYMVFFDFNKSDLSPQAVTIVDQAAKNAAPAKATELTVTGHTDTVGSDAYNMRLSRRRAESVAAELEKQGIKSSEIEIVAKGKHDLLVPTKDGVREPQNRRVTIVYGGAATS
jgi:iron complex outermembrane receptor protein